MPRELKFSNRFKKNFALAEKRGKKMDKLRIVLQLLQDGEPLPPKYRNHPLKGDWVHHLECHLEPDWLLIYQLSDEFVYLVATGTHSDLFDE